MYFKCDYTKVIGFEEALEVVKKKHPELCWPNDSHTTYVEDPVTLETAKHYFFLGDGDKMVLKNNELALDEFLGSIVVYVHAVSDDPFLLDVNPSISYLRLVEFKLDYRPHHVMDCEAFKNWLENLPHYDLIEKQTERLHRR